MRTFLAGSAGAWLLALSLLSCSTADEVFPPTGSVSLSVVDSGLTFQTGIPPGAQIVRWSIREASLQIEGYPLHSFLGGTTCEYGLGATGGSALSRACGGSGLVLGTETTGSPGVVRLEIARMDLFRAERPDLPDGGDYDGDGVPNGDDNCDLVPNPGQEDKNADSFGDACSRPTTDPINPDRDADGITDTVDNCVWISNPGQTDTLGGGSNGIGDECEIRIPVILPEGRFRLEETIEIPILNGSPTVLTVDFDEAKTLDCTPSLSSCTLDPEEVDLRVGP